MLCCSHGLLYSASARLVCVLREWDMHLLSACFLARDNCPVCVSCASCVGGVALGLVGARAPSCSLAPGSPGLRAG